LGDTCQGNSRKNYFFAIQVKSTQIKANASEIQNHLIENDPSLSQALIEHNSFHNTLKVIHLKNNSEVEVIKNAFTRAMSPFQQEFSENQILLDFQGVGEFSEQILYAKLNNEKEFKARLRPVLEKIAKEVGKSGIQFANQECWKPHLTLVNIRKVSRLRRMAKKLHPSLTSVFKNNKFGVELATSITFCSMQGPKNKENYYEILTEIKFDQTTT